MSSGAFEPARLSDAELIALCCEGNSRAWRALVDRYRRLVYGVPRAYRLQPADAEDVFQSTFGELLRYISRLRDPERLVGWLITTARRASVRHLIQERRLSRISHEDFAQALDPVATESAEDVIDRLEQAERVHRGVDALGDPCRSLLLAMFDDPPRPYRLLAAELGMALGSLGPTRARCLSRLRRALRRDRAPEQHPRSAPGEVRQRAKRAAEGLA